MRMATSLVRSVRHGTVCYCRRMNQSSESGDLEVTLEHWELSSGIDALYLSGKAAISEVGWESLIKWRAQAEEESEPISVILGGEEFSVDPHGWGKYRYSLRHRRGRLGITTSASLPTIRIQPLTEFLHATGPRLVVGWWTDLLSDICLAIELKASRVDVYADIQGWVPTIRDKDRFVTRATDTNVRYLGDRVTGFDFGRRESGSVISRIYDKTLHVQKTGADWWFDEWGDEYDASLPVMRVEFEFARGCLREFGIEDPLTATESAGDLWNYGCGKWLTHRIPTSDETRSRWPLSAFWRAVQEAGISYEPLGLERVRSGAGLGTVRRLLPGLKGQLTSMAVGLDTHDITDTLDAVWRVLMHDEDRDPLSFANRIVRKRQGQVS